MTTSARTYTTLRGTIGAADLGLFHRRLAVFGRQGRLAMRRAVGGNGGIQIVPIGRAGLGHHRPVIAPLVC